MELIKRIMKIALGMMIISEIFAINIGYMIVDLNNRVQYIIQRVL